MLRHAQEERPNEDRAYNTPAFELVKAMEEMPEKK
jgi:hypothetical protein